MVHMPEDKARKISRNGRGVFVAIIAVVLASAPFLGKASLRATVPSVWVPEEHLFSSTLGFFADQREQAFERAMSIATQLDASGGLKSSKRIASYREAVTTLNVFCVKAEQGLATMEQTPWPFAAFKKSEKARQSAERRAQHLNYVMMTWLSLAGAIFLVLVLRSHALPDWAKQITMMAAGAIIAGWFPL
jgi:hypothetical protein